MLGSPGERYREQQLAHQWPKQDLSLAYCKHVANNTDAFNDFVSGRNNSNALDVAFVKINNGHASVCTNCDGPIASSDLVVARPTSDTVSIIRLSREKKN